MQAMTKARRRQRWLARRDGVDYGPYTEEQLLEAIADREVTLETLVASTTDMVFEPLSAHEHFRSHYDTCQERWEVESVEADASRHEQKLKAMRVVKGGTWRMALVGALVILSLAGWMAWRLSNARPTGLLDAIAVAMPTSLPLAPSVLRVATPPAAAEARAVPRLRETTNTTTTYDTAGVAIEGSEGQGGTTSFDFDADPSEEISDAALGKVTRSARAALVPCAQALAGSDAGFAGTRVGFTVESGRLSRFVVGKEVKGRASFKACIKKALKGVSVPTFGGQERRVTVPLEVRR